MKALFQIVEKLNFLPVLSEEDLSPEATPEEGLWSPHLEESNERYRVSQTVVHGPPAVRELHSGGPPIVPSKGMP
ncbi:unnamed protein product [Natator depressus]